MRVSCGPMEPDKTSHIDRQIGRIGERISRLRKQAGLSLRDLADRTGVSFTTIQKIETSTIVPSIASVLKIAQGLGRNVSYLLDEAESPGDIRLVRRAERTITDVSASRLRVEDIGMDLRDALLQATVLTIEPGGISGTEPLQHPGEEIKLCLKGRMEYRVGAENFQLEEGDCLHFKSDIPHYWKNPGKEKAVILSVCTPPPFPTVSNLSTSAERGGNPRSDQNGIRWGKGSID